MSTRAATPRTVFTAEEKCTLRCLHRDTQLSRLLNEVPPPRRAVPANAPEEWHGLPLDRMMPMYEWPADTVLFSRNKIAKAIYSSAGADFDLYDPYCHTVSYEYEPLHDHNLRRQFKQKKTRQLLRDKGMISDTGDVICTLKQFNEYRRFLKRLYIMQVNRVRAEQDGENVDRMNFSNAERRAKKNLELCLRHELVDENRRKYREAMKVGNIYFYIYSISMVLISFSVGNGQRDSPTT